MAYLIKPASVLAMLWLITGGALSVPLKAQKFERLSVEQGLSHDSVYAIGQDAQGFMWFGTEDGLDKYDGYNITSFHHDPSNPNSLSSNDASEIYIEPSGIIWFATWGGGLNRYDPKTHTFKRFRHDPANPDSLSQDRIETICPGQNGVLWIGTETGGLNKFDKTTERFTRYRHQPGEPTGLSGDSIKALFEDVEGHLWIGTNHGLNRLDTETGNFFHYTHQPGNTSGLSSNRVRAIQPDSNGNLWIGTRGGGLNRFNPETGTFKIYKNDPDNPHSISDDSIASLFEDSAGIIWIGTYNGGLNRFDPAAETFRQLKYNPRDPHSLSHNRVEVIFQDRSEVLWLGTRGGGINKMDIKPAKFKNYTYDPDKSNSLPHPSVLALAEEPGENAVWIGTDGGGLSWFDLSKKQFKHFKHEPRSRDSLCNNRVWSLLADKRGNLWVGTYFSGLNKMVPAGGGYHFFHYKHNPDDPASISSNRIDILMEDNDGDIWVGTDRGLDILIRPRHLRQLEKTVTFKRFSPNPGKPTPPGSDHVTSIIQDHTGLIWYGTHTQLVGLDKKSGRFTTFTHEPGNPRSLSNNSILAIYETSENFAAGSSSVLWIGTEQGLNKFDRRTRTFTHYNEHTGLPANRVSGILADDRGNLWISTSRGLAKFNPAAGTSRNYDISDGLQSRGFNRNACLRRKNGEMILGSIGGLTVFTPERVLDNPYVPPVVLTSFKKFNRATAFAEPASEIKEIRLTHKENFISFEFAALDYTNPSKNQYAYKMDGIDRDWIPSGSRHFAGYPGLSPGRYQFHARGSNNDGVWNKKGISVKIIIIPPFWKTWWFRGLVLLALGMLLFIGFRIRVRRVHERNKELEKANALLAEQVKKREQAEGESAILKERLRHVQKLETIGTLAGGIAHDFNNILGPILGYTEMALEETPADNVVHGWLEGVARATQRARDLVRQILVFARRDRQEFTSLHIQMVIKEALKLVRASLPATIEIRQDIADDCEPVLADLTQIHQVCMNLCANSRHALLEKGGTLTVQLKMENVDTEFARLHPNLKPGKYVIFKVNDTGYGMTPETLVRLFEPFYTTKKPGEGTGMGLSVVHGIVMAHGGEIAVSSIIGQGTVFTVYFPVAEEEPEKVPEKNGKTPVGSEYVLVVDDEESMTIMVQAMLEKLGYKVTALNSSIEALKMFKDNPDRFDLVLTD
ncbi:MAG: hypothetical protein GY950_24230, partial [bacterium]|nr:hypothetical protein [bacterium]